MIFATAGLNEAARWHFPGRPPKNLPGMGKCGMVRRRYTPQEDPTGNLITLLLEWMDQSGRTDFEDFAAFMASLPVGTPPAVIAALTALPGEARRLLESHFGRQRARGVTEGIASVFPMLPAPPQSRHGPYEFVG